MLAKTIEHVIKVNIKGKDYLYQFQNAWDPVKQRSYSKHRITLGRLIDGKVELGRKFLRNNLISLNDSNGILNGSNDDSQRSNGANFQCRLMRQR
ncbi:hypothetical protein [uncultured Parasutterella sp.]|uniref:hypothetical protein n=1 Tax=uncultured Parasutterella sp. TaxID=1263098 RepID=UPI0025B6B609|nr:hypothetical protein [uncultured Parasutterella sp.]